VRPILFAILLFTALTFFGQPVIVPNLGQWDAAFRAKTALSDGAVFWTDQGYRIRVVHPKHRGGAVPNPHYPTSQWPESWPDAHAVFVDFLGAQSTAQSVGSDPTPSLRHYLLGRDAQHWVSNVPEFEDWRTTNVYPGIDFVVHAHEGLKSEWRVAPKADPTLIRLSIRGTRPEVDAAGALRLSTPMGTWIEDRPVAFTLGKSGKTPVSAAYRIVDDTVVVFDLGPYRRSDTLVIDPNLVFSSFSGSTADNWGYTATYDNQENLYGGGIVFDVGYPTSPGAFDASYNDPSSGFSTMDIGLTKFSANGTQRIYSTYIGGDGPDQPHSMMVNSAGELVIMGTTGSSDFPVTAGAYDGSFNGGPPANGSTGSPLAFNFDDGVDLFVLKVNPSGSALTASTFVGTAGNEGLNLGIALNYGDAMRGEVVVDALDQVFVVTSTQSSSFPGATATNMSTDAVAFSMNSSLSAIRWATLLGGNNHESGYGIKTDANGKVFVTGGTRSTNFPSTAGGLHATARGGVDGWIARLSSAGVLEKATYLGTSGNDQSFLLDLDKYGAVYVFGQSLGIYPQTSGTWGTPNGSQFIHKLNADLNQTLFSTRFGSSNSIINIVPSAFNVDDCLNILLSGWGGGVNGGGLGGTTAGLPVSSNALRPTTDGSDFYFMVLSRNAQSLTYATYFGGTSSEHVDGGTSRFSPRGNIFQAVCAACGGQSFPTTPGVVGPTRNSSNCNLGVIKIDFETSVTADASIDFEADVDTLCDELVVTFTNGSANANKFLWDFGNGQTSVAYQPTVRFSKGTYRIRLTAIDTICDIQDTTSLVITHDKGIFPEASFEHRFKACDRTFEVVAWSTSIDAQLSNWTFDGGSAKTGDTVVHRFNSPGTHVIRLVVRDTVCGTTDTAFASVFFDPDLPAPDVKVAPDSCKDGRIRVNVSYTLDSIDYQFRWIFPNGVVDTGRVTTYRVPTSGTYTVKLELIDTVCNAVYPYEFTSAILRYDQRVWIPNTFTPNDDGRNELLVLGGNNCFENDHFTILNSFGNVVFETDRPFDVFWDGTLNGKPAQQDTYVYRFETEDGPIVGYVNLIR
jgi:gliding motility-associated-like protein